MSHCAVMLKNTQYSDYNKYSNISKNSAQGMNKATPSLHHKKYVKKFSMKIPIKSCDKNTILLDIHVTIYKPIFNYTPSPTWGSQRDMTAKPCLYLSSLVHSIKPNAASILFLSTFNSKLFKATKSLPWTHPIKDNSNIIELTMHTSHYCVLDLLCVKILKLDKNFLGILQSTKQLMGHK